MRAASEADDALLEMWPDALDLQDYEDTTQPASPRRGQPSLEYAKSEHASLLPVHTIANAVTRVPKVSSPRRNDGG